MKRERLQAVMEGRRPDRTPVSFWQHFPDLDHDAEQLAEALVEFQRRYDLDFVKLMPSGMYGTEDFGCETGEPDPETGAKRLLKGPISQVSDWAALRPVPPDRGARGRELRCLELVRRALGPEVPIIQTVFSPSTTAAKIMGRDAFIAAAREHPDAIEAALDMLAETEAAFARAAVDRGADGVFFATQLAGDGLMTADEYRRFGVAYDMRVLEAIASRSWFSMVHVHGSTPLFSLFSSYPVPAISWHDRRTSPSLSEARDMWPGVFACGLDEWGVLRTGDPEAVRADVEAMIGQADATRFILAPGCVLPLNVPPENLEAVRGAVESSNP